jgi:hypothetical protein
MPISFNNGLIISAGLKDRLVIIPFNSCYGDMAAPRSAQRMTIGKIVPNNNNNKTNVNSFQGCKSSDNKISKHDLIKINNVNRFRRCKSNNNNKMVKANLMRINHVNNKR